MSIINQAKGGERAAMVIVPLAVVATVVVTATLSGGHSHQLPLPIIVPAAQAAPIHRTPHVNADGSIVSGASSAQGQTYTTTPPVPLTGCAVSVSNPSPLQGQTAEKVSVQTAPDARVTLVAQYPNRVIHHGGVADNGGGVTFDLLVNHAPVGVNVPVTATASLRGVQKSCSTSFTPH